MKRQFSEIQSQLAESRRKCQQVESTSQETTQTVSEHNLNFISTPNSPAIECINTTTLEPRNPRTYTHTQHSVEGSTATSPQAVTITFNTV